MKALITSLLIAITTNLYSQNIEWETNLGGSAYDYATDIQQTSDSGYIVAGYTYSTDGDVGGNNGDNDYWIVKLNNTGNIIWENNLGGSGDDRATAIQQTADDGYIVAGYTYSPDGDTDYWVVKIDTTGNLIWETYLGGSGWDEAFSIQQTSDGGYIIAGQSESNDGDVGGNNGQWDCWIVKLNNTGNLIWETNLGGSDTDKAFSIRQTTDGGFIVAGYSESDDGDVGENNGSQDYWIVKLDNTGYLIWETNLGGSSGDFAYSIQQTNDNGYIIAGSSRSSDGDVGGNNGFLDYWIVKLDNTGNLIWETNLGGSGNDGAFNSIQQTTDGGYIVAGGSTSNNGDVGGNNGDYDYWIVKLDNTGNLIWETNLGGSNSDYASSIQQTFDGGFIVAGTSYSSDGDVGGNNGNNDYWVVKLEGTLGIEDNIASKISLSPNPTTNTITIANLSQKITKVELLDMQGRIVLSQSEVINYTINISSLQSATYIVKIYVGRTVFYKKVIKE